MRKAEHHAWTAWPLRLLLLMKSQLKKPLYWIALACGFAVLEVLLHAQAPGICAEYGVCSSGGETASAVIEALREESADSQSKCVVYQDQEKMKEDLMSGRLDCAFVLDARLDEGLANGSFDGCADYYCTASTVQGDILKEQIYAELFGAAARQRLITSAQDGSTFKNAPPGSDKAAEIEENLLDGYSRYRKDPQLFTVNFITENGGQAAQQTDTAADDARVAAGMVLFILALVFARSRFNREQRRIMTALTGHERRCWALCVQLAPTLPAALLFGAAAAPGPAFILAMLLYGVLCSLWSVLFASLFRSEAMYLLSIISAAALTALTCPAFFTYAALTPALAGLKWIFPLQYLLVLS